MAKIENEPKCGINLNSFERKGKVLLTLMLRMFFWLRKGSVTLDLWKKCTVHSFCTKQYHHNVNTDSVVAVVQFLSHFWLFETPWTAACQAFLSFSISGNLLKFMSLKLGMPCSCLILCYPLLLPPLIFSSIKVFSNESALHIRWSKC